MDSTKLLTEKLTLARELSSLLPELEHLRSQALSNQALLTEKLSLQQQVCTLRIELESEKALSRRTTSNAIKSNAQDVKIATQLGQASADIHREKRDKQCAVGEAEKRCEQMQRRVTNLESRLQTSNDKLKTAQGSLRETQIKLKKAQQAKNDQSLDASPTKKLAKSPRKRIYEDMNADSLIGTPGNPTLVKTSKSRFTAPGEKSMFSVTPFLTRTQSECPAKPNVVVHNDRLVVDTAKEVRASTAGLTIPALLAPVAQVEPMEAESTINGAIDINKTKREVATKLDAPMLCAPKLTAAAELERVAEEGRDEPAPSHTKDMVLAGARISTDETLAAGVLMKKKKRRLLGQAFDRSILGDDDVDAMREPSVPIEGRKFAEAGKRVCLSLKTRHITGRGFGAISPLKRVKR